MRRIAFIGAGSRVFTRNICSDLLFADGLQDATLALMDPDAGRLAGARDLVQAMVDQRGAPARVEATTDRRTALRGADAVITSFDVGGLDALEHDIEIPRRYGVEQNVGDTLGPGGVLRGLRSIPLLLDVCADLDDVAPDALLLNYVNPMAPLCWAVARATGRPHVGLCHSVQGTSRLLAGWAGVPVEEVTFLCAGINHLAFFLTFRHGEEDLYPRLREAIETAEVQGLEPVRSDLMRAFGFFVTESSGHASEYVPYFRKSARAVEEELAPRFVQSPYRWLDHGRTGGYLRFVRERQSDAEDERIPAERSDEYAAAILEAIVTDRPAKINGNVPNAGVVDGLPDGCCVEVPCLVDGGGVQPVHVGRLPPQLAGLMRTNVNVQELVVEAALTGSREAVHHAIALDPLTAAACTLPQIRAMTDELLEAEAPWLPALR